MSHVKRGYWGLASVKANTASLNIALAVTFRIKRIDSTNRYGVIIFTRWSYFIRQRPMTDKTRDTKRKALQRQGALNPRPGQIKHPLFQNNEFFDPDDMIQVKYEMLRQVRIEQQTVTEVAKAFGFSRPSFYQAQLAFEQNGLPGLMAQKRGPRTGHKLTAEVMDFLNQARVNDSSLGTDDLLRMVKEKFGVIVHRRSMERQLVRQKKRR